MNTRQSRRRRSLQLVAVRSVRACNLLQQHNSVSTRLALHGLAAYRYLLNGSHRSSNAAVYKADVNKDGGC